MITYRQLDDSNYELRQNGACIGYAVRASDGLFRAKKSFTSGTLRKYGLHNKLAELIRAMEASK